MPVPDAVLDYNKHMGGVDLSDALVGYYSVQHKTMKWYKTLFYHFLDVPLVNSFILWKQLKRYQSGSVSTQNKFREQLSREMMQFAIGAPPSSTPTVTATPNCMPYYYGSDATEAVPEDWNPEGENPNLV